MILDNLATLKSKTTTYDSEGMPIDVWTANNTSIFVNIQAKDESPYIVGQVSNFDDNEKYIIFARKNTSITKGKRIEYDGDTYEITRVKKWGTHYELYCYLV